jgi:hypothetical protein
MSNLDNLIDALLEAKEAEHIIAARKALHDAWVAKGEPVAWMRDKNSVMTADDKRRMIEHGAKHGREFAIVAKDAESYNTPLYTAPPDMVMVPRELTDKHLRAMDEVMEQRGHFHLFADDYHALHHAMISVGEQK